jgi:hypothetical protein
VSVFTENGLENWSELTIFLGANDALCSYEVEDRTSSGRSLPDLWGQGGRKM